MTPALCRLIAFLTAITFLFLAFVAGEAGMEYLHDIWGRLCALPFFIVAAFCIWLSHPD